jgi:hypothetical protein
MNSITGRVVKNTVKSKVFPVQAMKAYEGSRGIAPFILKLGISIRRRFTSLPFPGKKTLLSIEYEVGLGLP